MQPNDFTDADVRAEAVNLLRITLDELAFEVGCAERLKVVAEFVAAESFRSLKVFCGCAQAKYDEAQRIVETFGGECVDVIPEHGAMSFSVPVDRYEACIKALGEAGFKFE
jgi:acetolactate synthase small subunit